VYLNKNHTKRGGSIDTYRNSLYTHEGEHTTRGSSATPATPANKLERVRHLAGLEARKAFAAAKHRETLSQQWPYRETQPQLPSYPPSTKHWSSPALHRWCDTTLPCSNDARG